MDRPGGIDHSIRKNMSRFFMDKVIGSCKEVDSDIKNFLLVLDERTTKIVDKFATIIDLVEVGIIGIEKLSAKRKEFPRFHIIYFIDPNPKSMSLLKADFKPDGDRKDPLYSTIHVVFSRHIEEEDWKPLGDIKELQYALCSLKIGNAGEFIEGLV